MSAQSNLSAFGSGYSVLLSVYHKDKPEYLRDAIDSMLSQTMRPNEIVIVYDGPVPASIKDAVHTAESESDIPFVVIQLEKNLGLGGALSIGLKECRSPYIARMDADDISRRDRCELEYTLMVQDGLDLIGGWIEEFIDGPGDIGMTRETPTSMEEVNRYLKLRNPFNHVSVMLNKDSVISVGNYQPFLYVEDYWLWVRMISAGMKCVNIPRVLVDVRVGNGMYARRGGRRFIASQVKLLKEMYKLDLLGIVDFCIGVLVRVAGSLVPVGVRTYIYQRFLRTDSNTDNYSAKDNNENR